MFYQQEVSKVFNALNTNECGLDNTEAEERLKTYGKNKIGKEKRIELGKILLHQFVDPLIYILVISAFITFIIGEHVNTGIIVAIVILNALIGFFQQYKAEKATEAINKLTSDTAIVIRQGKEYRIDATLLVPGDIIILAEGNKVPADVRIFESNELSADESMLTGESMPSKKNALPIESDTVSITDISNMCFLGTVIVQGKGRAVITYTGEHTELGKISKQVKETVKDLTPLQKKLNKLTKLIGIVSVSLALFVFIIGSLMGNPIIDMLIFAISMAVAVIPEGLPIVITVTMAVGLKRMVDKNAIVRKLIAVETLGSCNFICSDKTGTITQNVMTVTNAHAGGKDFVLTGSGYNPKGEIKLNDTKISEDKELEFLLMTGLLCNDSDIFEENGKWFVNGDATEGALVTSALKYGINSQMSEYQYKHIEDLPFNSVRQFMATLREKNGELILFVKGAPEKILKFCNEESNEYLQKKYEEMASNGLRVLGFGYKKINSNDVQNVDLELESCQELKFVGFQGIIDPPKPNVIEAIKATTLAGIKTVMVTGDNIITATAIAKQIGIFKESDISITGIELNTKDENFLKDKCEKISVYARVSPSDKLKIVDALQKNGNIVAVTGDGVNDAPALKKSDIGVAMGKEGTDVAREASDVILKDDNFATIFEAIKIGRKIYDNIQKVIFFLLGTGIGLALSIILSLVTGDPLPFLPTQVLWINLVTNGLQDIALAYEPGEEGLTNRPPRNPKERILNKFISSRLLLVGVIIGIGTFIVYNYHLEQGYAVEYCRTVALNTAVFFQFFHVWNSRSFDISIFKLNPFSNPLLIISQLLALLAQMSIIIIPSLNFLFETTPLNLSSWIITILTGSSIILIIEIDKILRKREQIQAH